jgi:hypothetical protein
LFVNWRSCSFSANRVELLPVILLYFPVISRCFPDRPNSLPVNFGAQKNARTTDELRITYRCKLAFFEEGLAVSLYFSLFARKGNEYQFQNREQLRPFTRAKNA